MEIPICQSLFGVAIYHRAKTAIPAPCGIAGTARGVAGFTTFVLHGIVEGALENHRKNGDCMNGVGGNGCGNKIGAGTGIYIILLFHICVLCTSMFSTLF